MKKTQFVSCLFFLLGATTLVAEPISDAQWLKDEVRRQFEGCRVESVSGYDIYTPDGIGHYEALWTRDYHYYFKYAGELIDRENVKASIAFMLSGQREDGCIPDRVKVDGTPIYSPGGENKPLADHALDNAPFLASLACLYAKRHDDIAYFKEIELQLKEGLDHIRRAENGLVYSDPENPECVYGFTDIVTKTGHLLFSSLIYYQACQDMAELGAQIDSPHVASYRERAQLIKESIDHLWDEESGMFLAADVDCRQIDIWGSALAYDVGLISKKRAKRVAGYFLENWDDLVQRGQVRHLAAGETWQRLFHPCKAGEYQNGAYWSTPLPWIVPVVALLDEEKAESLILDTIADFRANGVWECVNGEYSKVVNYVPSITNLHGAHEAFYKK